MSDAIVYKGAVETLGLLERGEVSSVELVQEYVAQCERFPWVNALVTFDTERALRRAADADQTRSQAAREGHTLPAMHGLPITIKQDLKVEGVPSTFGHVPLKDHIPTVDAPAVARLREGGGIVFARSNLPEFAADGQAYNELHGTTVNPWSKDHATGGSSGGSASAVAAGMSPLDLGSDMGGSIRLPASWCGTYGLKPTWGLVPTGGGIPTGEHAPGAENWKLDVLVSGPLARRAEDLELALDVLVDQTSSTAGLHPVLPPAKFQEANQLRVLAWLDDDKLPTDPATLEVLENALEALRDAGAQVDYGVVGDGNIKALEEIMEMSFMADVAGTSDLEMYEAMVAGTQALVDDPRMSQAMSAQHLRGLQLTHREWILLQLERTRHCREWAQTFTQYDVVVTPAAFTTAQRHDHSLPVDARRFEVEGKSYPWRPSLTHWLASTGVLRVPSVSTPVGISRDGLPVGMQVVGPEYGDRTAIAAAGIIGRTAGHLPVPTPLR